MWPEALKKEVPVLFEAVTKAALLCRKLRSAYSAEQIGVMTKSDQSPVTVADISAQLIINEQLRSAFPDDLIIGEEEATEITPELLKSLQAALQDYPSLCNKSANELEDLLRVHWDSNRIYNRYWAVDPIDGTKGFIRGDQYAVCVALVDGTSQEPILAALGCPNLTINDEEGSERGLMMISVKGLGNFKCRLGDAFSCLESIPVVAQVDCMQDVRFTGAVESSSTPPTVVETLKSHLNVTLPTIRIDSQCKYALLALNRAHAYYRQHRSALTSDDDYTESIWDNAPGYLFVVEGGGQVTGFDGDVLRFPCSKYFTVKGGIVASTLPTELHQLVLKEARALNHSE